MENLNTKTKSDPIEKIIKQLGIVVLIVCFFSVGFAIGRMTGSNGTTSGSTFDLTKGLFTKGTTNNEDVDMSLFWEVWKEIDDNYVDQSKPDEEKMVYGAIKGMVDSLEDPATLFFDPEETANFNKQNEGKLFEGIGAELGYRDGLIIVVAPIDGSPAQKAGLLPGDQILKVDDREITSEDTVYDVVGLIRGESGTTVKLTIYRKGDLSTQEISITRGEITLPSITVKKIDDTTSEISIARFTDTTLQEWKNNWDDAVAQVQQNGSTNIILDLRNNPGGFFDAAVYAAEDFLPKDTIIAKQRDQYSYVTEFKVTRTGELLDKKVVVIVNDGSASASEILAGALQYNDKAKVVGISTYGKGTAQTIVPFSDGSTLHITILKWLLPDGKWLNRENPIIPDYEIKNSTEDFLKGVDNQLSKALELLK